MFSRVKVGLAAITCCQVQLCTVLGFLASKLCDCYCLLVRAYTKIGPRTINSDQVNEASFLLQLDQSPASRPQLAGATATGFNPFIYGNDVDSVDVATRVAMVSALFHRAEF